jgi:D-3-phosphoglycerate dehydrogenase / 2-oxoglutarate reductase
VHRRLRRADHPLPHPGRRGLLAAAGPRLRVVGRGGVGVDNIDLDAASRRGILVVNAPEANNVSAAELAIALLLAAARGVARSDARVRRGVWDRSFLGRELDGAALGIVGLGRIGSLVARRAQGLGMHVSPTTPTSPPGAPRSSASAVDDLHAMLAQVGFLSVHTPLTEETRGLIDAAALAALPRGAVVVNAARGGIVDEAALPPRSRRGTCSPPGSTCSSTSRRRPTTRCSGATTWS